MIERGDFIAVAVSGGADSMALLHFLAENQSSLGISVSAIHIDHMLRGKESYEDLLFVQSFCQKHSISFSGGQVDAGKAAAYLKMGIQEAARHVRYTFLKEEMDKLGANKLATAHHADDQMETVLMQLARGGHTHTGIPFIRPLAEKWIIRPFLSVTKEEILTYCRNHDLSYREDPSNKKPDYTRNRFRHSILPFLKKENPKAPAHIQRFAEERQEDEAFLKNLAQEEIQKITTWKQSEVTLETDPFVKVPIPLQRRAIHLILNYLYHGKTAFSFLHIQQTLQLLQSPAPSGKLNLPSGLSVIKIGDHCLFTYETNSEKQSSGPFFLLEGDRVDWQGKGTFTISAHGESPAGAECFYLKRDARLPICIRTLQEGDRIQLKGMVGSKKIARLFIDEKVPLAYRSTMPIVTDAEGTVLWVPGIRKSVHEGGGPMLLIYEKE